MDSKFTLEWKNLNVSVKVKGGDKHILKNQAGWAESGQVLGIIGASGSGKTTLLNYLSGFIGPELKSSAEITLGQTQPISNKTVRALSGYVLQEDILQTQLTVSENIEYSARFKLPGAKDLKSKVERSISMLSLEKCRNTRIGTEFQRGVSGGEKKRCCIAMELVNEPPILFLDEPTTGLDSVNAEDVVVCLKELAKANRLIVCTIHQPSAELLKMFDRLIIMHEGMAVYNGSYDQISSFYSDHGVSIPNYVNQVEYILTCLNMTETNCQLLADATSGNKTNYFEYQTVSTIKKICLEASENAGKDRIPFQTDTALIDTLLTKGQVRKNGFFTSLRVQMSRTFKTYFRDRRTFLAQIIVNFFYIVLALILFRDLKVDQAGVQNRIGALYYLMMLAIMSMIQITSMSFSTGLVVLKKELMQGQYTPTSYFLGVTIPPDLPTIIIMLSSTICIFFIADLNFSSYNKLWNYTLLIAGSIQAGEGFGHILAASFSDPAKTAAAIPIVLMPLQLFSGFLFSLKTMPQILLPLSYISVFRYSLEGLVVNEFTDLTCDEGVDCAGEPARHGYESSVKDSIILLFVIAMGCRLLSLLIFHIKYRKYYNS